MCQLDINGIGALSVTMNVGYVIHSSRTSQQRILSIDGCFFHFPQALMRKIQSLGHKRQYERDSIDINGIRTYTVHTTKDMDLGDLRD